MRRCVEEAEPECDGGLKRRGGVRVRDGTVEIAERGAAESERVDGESGTADRGSGTAFSIRRTSSSVDSPPAIGAVRLMEDSR